VTQPCFCPGGKSGAQTCEKDGKSWGACLGCGTAADGGPDTRVPDAKVGPDHSQPPDRALKDQALPDISPADQHVVDIIPADKRAPDQTTPDLSPPDLSTPDLAPPDQGLPDQTVPPDAVLPDPSAIQLVVNSLALPKKSSEYAADLDGNGKKENQWGNVLSALAGILPSSLSFQDEVNAQLKKGFFLLLFDVLSKSLVNAASMSLKMHLGVDQDANPADNFTGNEVFGISKSSPPNLSAKGKIVAGQMQTGPGTMTAPLVFPESAPVFVTLKLAKVEGTLSTKGLTAGQFNGAIPWTEMDKTVIPAFAASMNSVYTSTTDTSVKNLLMTMFDSNADGKITAAEVKKSILSGIFLKPDVDTDGDKKKDAMSVGFGFTAVTCKFKSP